MVCSILFLEGDGCMGYIKDSSALPSSMTSNTGSNGKASVSTFADNYLNLAYRVFDKNTGTYWQAQFKSGWAKYEFDLPIVISKYSLRATGTINGAPKQWTFEGSDDNQNWSVLDSRTNITNWTSGLIQEYVFSNNIKYKFYRLNIVTTKDDTERIQLSEIDMFELVYYDKFLISSEDKYYSFETTDPTKNLIPVMTSNNAPSGVASASGYYTATDFQPWQSFSGTSTLYWVGRQGEVTGWLRYDFNEPRVINVYSMTASGFSNGAQPKDWTFEGSDDGLNWTVLDKRVNQTNWVFYTEVRTFEFKNAKAYKSYRINVSSNNGNTVYLAIAQVKMMERSMKMYEMPVSEAIYLGHGMNKALEIKLEDFIAIKKFIVNQNTALGSGKLFRQKIDRSKHRAKKIILG